jgi:hypothetical protein
MKISCNRYDEVFEEEIRYNEHIHDTRTTTTNTNSISAQNVIGVGYWCGCFKDCLRVRHTTTKNGHNINNSYIRVYTYTEAQKCVHTSTYKIFLLK